MNDAHGIKHRKNSIAVYNISMKPRDNLDQLLDPETLLQVAEHLSGTTRTNPVSKQSGRLAFETPVEQLAKDAVRQILAGYDPLGTAYCRIHSPQARRASGQTFTPLKPVESMFAWAIDQSCEISRIVDPGAGSGRYTLYGLRRFANARAVAIERDPDVALILRANAVALGVESRLDVIVADYREVSLPPIPGRTLFIGNPPYVRHHDIAPDWKHWYSSSLQALGHASSQLAGLHLHFFLKTLELARPGDLGCFVTAAEWLDVKYGQALRDLLTNGLGGKAVAVMSPELAVFEDAMVSAAVTCFAPHSSQEKLSFQQIENMRELQSLGRGRPVERQTARREKTWSILVRNGHRDRPSGQIELGEVFKVHRGQVTGLNRVWVHGPASPTLPNRFLFPCITDARDITTARGHLIDSPDTLKSVVDLPENLDGLKLEDRAQVDRFLEWAKVQGADKTYIARHRNPWWRVRLKVAAPIVVTYMGRRPPVFGRNVACARLINIAHGLYPRDDAGMDEDYLRALVGWLNTNVSQESGRSYAGGLTKFEPSEVMRLYIPEKLTPAHHRHATA